MWPVCSPDSQSLLFFPLFSFLHLLHSLLLLFCPPSQLVSSTPPLSVSSIFLPLFYPRLSKISLEFTFFSKPKTIVFSTIRNALFDYFRDDAGRLFNLVAKATYAPLAFKHKPYQEVNQVHYDGKAKELMITILKY